MRLFMINLVATALVLFGAASASAFGLHMTSNYDGVSVLVPGNTIDVSIFLDANLPGIQLLSVGLQFDNTVLQYTDLGTIGAGVPTYILYNSVGMPMLRLDAASSTWALWPGTVPVGMDQVNVNWAENTLAGTIATGLGLKIAQVRFTVLAAGDGVGEIVMTLSGGGNIFQASNDPNTPVALTGTPVNVITPEPTTAVLVGLGLLGLGVAGRRR